MARKTFRDDDIVISFTGEETIGTVGGLLDQKGCPRRTMKVLFEEKLVLLNGYKTNPKASLQAGDVLRLQMPKEKLDHEPIPMDLAIAYEDYDLLVIDKAAGLTVNSEGQVSLANGVAHYFKEQGIKRKIRFLNRLDRDTSGCIVIAKSALAQSFYQGQMENHRFKKFYRAYLEGNLKAAELNEAMEGVSFTDICNIMTQQCRTIYSLEFPMGRAADGIHQEVSSHGKPTRTDFEIVSYQEDLDQTCVDVELYTGRTHQIRVAFSHIGYPLVGDVLYGAQATAEPFALRAYKIEFKHMRTGQKITVAV